MSVIKNLRKLSLLEYLITARLLEIYTIKQCVKFPKKYTFFINQPIVNISKKIYLNLKISYTINPSNSHLFQMKKDYIIKTNGELYNLISQLLIANEIFNIETKIIQKWMELINKEIKLINKHITYILKKYKKFI